MYLSSSTFPPIAVNKLCRSVLAQLAGWSVVLTRDEHCDADRGHSSSAALDAALVLNGEGSDVSDVSESDRTDSGRGQLAMLARAPSPSVLVEQR